VIGGFPEPPAPTHPFPRSMLVRSGQSQFRLVPASVLGTCLSEIAVVHGSANHLSELLHNLGRKEHLPVPPDEPRREAPTSEHRQQADLTGQELAGHRLGGAQRHQAWLLDRPIRRGRCAVSISRFCNSSPLLISRWAIQVPVSFGSARRSP